MECWQDYAVKFSFQVSGKLPQCLSQRPSHFIYFWFPGMNRSAPPPLDHHWHFLCFLWLFLKYPPHGWGEHFAALISVYPIVYGVKLLLCLLATYLSPLEECLHKASTVLQVFILLHWVGGTLDVPDVNSLSKAWLGTSLRYWDYLFTLMVLFSWRPLFPLLLCLYCIFQEWPWGSFRDVLGWSSGNNPPLAFVWKCPSISLTS